MAWIRLTTSSSLNFKRKFHVTSQVEHGTSMIHILVSKEINFPWMTKMCGNKRYFLTHKPLDLKCHEFFLWLQIVFTVNVLCDSSSQVSTKQVLPKENATEIDRILGAARAGSWNLIDGRSHQYTDNLHGETPRVSKASVSPHVETSKGSNASVSMHQLMQGLNAEFHKHLGRRRFVPRVKGGNHIDIETKRKGNETKTTISFHDCRVPESRCGSVKKLDEVYAALHRIVKKYSNLAKLSVIGKTYRGNPIHVVEIHSGTAFYYGIVVVDFGMHAREWASLESALYVMEKLLEEGGKMVENIQWFIIPMVNPDGYVYSTHANNLWRKNRRPIKGTKCSGVDLNRNFGVGWEPSLSVDPCREDYSGSEPFSEIETKVIRDFVKDIDPLFVDAYVSVHSCMQSIYHPYEYTEEEPRAELLENLKEVGAKMAKAIYKVRNQSYYVGTNSKYFAGGGDVGDFMFGHFHVPLVFRLDLGDIAYFDADDYHQCYHPPEQAMAILTKECLAGLRALAHHLIETRVPYRNKKVANVTTKEERQLNETIPSAAHRNRRITFEHLVALVTLQGHRLVTQ